MYNSYEFQRKPLSESKLLLLRSFIYFHDDEVKTDGMPLHTASPMQTLKSVRFARLYPLHSIHFSQQWQHFSTASFRITAFLISNCMKG